MQHPATITRDLVLIGGGHSHAIALRHFLMNPLPGVRITLISAGSNTPYSGMLPGHVAGHYSYDECHIDLRPLTRAVGAQFYVDRVVGLDLTQQRVLCAQRPPVAFDVLSIDIGSTPTLPEVPGAAAYSVPVKPWAPFLAQWQQLVAEIREQPAQPMTIAIAGGGAGGVELALTIRYRLKQLLQDAQQPWEQIQIHVVHRGQQVMPSHNGWVRRRFAQILAQEQIQVHLGERVEAVHGGVVYGASGLQLSCDRIFWVTKASAPTWPGDAGLAIDDQGFIEVQPTLQSMSHPQVFAAGDIASMVTSPRPKAGVFAVRQGRPLADNIRRWFGGEPLKPFQPQRFFLSLVSTGSPDAVLSWGPVPWGWQSPKLWQWKDHIDRKFMNQFAQLPAPMLAPSADVPVMDDAPMHCAGCGSKVGRSVLSHTLRRLQQDYPAVTIPGEIVVGVGDDAAVVESPAGQLMVHTLDYFRSFIDDPFIFGQICAHHCLSDLFAMGAQPQTGLAIATLPYAIPPKQEETLYQLLSGATKVLQGAGAALVGGHTTVAADLALGLSCNGVVGRDRMFRKGNLQPDHALILTKPLGTGALLAADQRLQAKGRWIDTALASMLHSNQAAAACFWEHQAMACTDITGFGLLGHVLELVADAQVTIELNLDALPSLPGVFAVIEQGIVSSLHSENAIASNHVQNLAQAQTHPHWDLLFDPQTSGGLVAAVPCDQLTACLDKLQDLGYHHSCQIGQVLAHQPLTKTVRCT